MHLRCAALDRLVHAVVGLSFHAEDFVSASALIALFSGIAGPGNSVASCEFSARTLSPSRERFAPRGEFLRVGPRRGVGSRPEAHGDGIDPTVRALLRAIWEHIDERRFTASELLDHAETPSRRTLHSAVWTGSRMIVWGGSTVVDFRQTVPTNTGAVYDPGTDTWQAMSTDCGVPSERSWFQAVWTGTELLIWSEQNSRPTLSGARYNPTSNSWQRISLANAPTATAYETMVWTGASALLYQADTRQGFRYQP